MQTKQEIIRLQNMLAESRSRLRELIRKEDQKQDGQLAFAGVQERLQNLKAIDDVYKDIEYIKSRLVANTKLSEKE